MGTYLSYEIGLHLDVPTLVRNAVKQASSPKTPAAACSIHEHGTVNRRVLYPYAFERASLSFTDS